MEDIVYEGRCLTSDLGCGAEATVNKLCDEIERLRQVIHDGHNAGNWTCRCDVCECVRESSQP